MCEQVVCHPGVAITKTFWTAYAALRCPPPENGFGQGPLSKKGPSGGNGPGENGSSEKGSSEKGSSVRNGSTVGDGSGEGSNSGDGSGGDNGSNSGDGSRDNGSNSAAREHAERHVHFGGGSGACAPEVDQPPPQHSLAYGRVKGKGLVTSCLSFLPPSPSLSPAPEVVRPNALSAYLISHKVLIQ